MSTPVLRLLNIDKTYDDGFQAIENFNLDINKGEFVTLLGPSGCGKTSILKIIGGFEDPTKGKLLYNNIDIKDMSITDRPTSTVFQDYALFPNMTVEQNIKYGLKLMRTPIENVSANLTKQAEKVEIEATKKAKKQILAIDKKRKSIEKDLEKINKKYEKNNFLLEIKEMRRPQYLAVVDELWTQLENKYGEDYVSKITFKQKLLDTFNGWLATLRINKQFDIDLSNMNEIEQEIFKIKKWYRFKMSIDKIFDHLSDKYNDLDYEVSYWQTYPQLHREKFENKNTTRRLNQDEINQRLNEVVDLVGLKGKEKSYPSDLSGGMQQRVALARSIVIRPEVLLLDEPLSALDAKVRKQLQEELKRLHNELGISFILVTHDQEEALMLSDKIVVMSNGKIEQIGTPNEIYDSPKNLWVANFIGRANFFDGIYLGNGKVQFNGIELKTIFNDEQFAINEKVHVMIRPEDFDVVENNQGFIQNAIVKNVSYKGLLWDITCEHQGIQITVEAINKVENNKEIGLSVDPEDIHLIKVENESN